MVFNKLYLKILFIKQRTTFKITTINQREGEDRGTNSKQGDPRPEWVWQLLRSATDSHKEVQWEGHGEKKGDKKRLCINGRQIMQILLGILRTCYLGTRDIRNHFGSSITNWFRKNFSANNEELYSSWNLGKARAIYKNSGWMVRHSRWVQRRYQQCLNRLYSVKVENRNDFWV